ncbi:importin subunit alpha-B isoform X2 [Parasteatoda tepidariorum]|uniref:importin subunit alpha-B isoform X2 n=1 Tax=Parasteatoda tepidariorum TaxID=114398 RepID=UPI001C723AE4|nr:importin subunit alpha-9 isoform X2 [Parasteatoda tepidariorum]
MFLIPSLIPYCASLVQNVREKNRNAVLAQNRMLSTEVKSDVSFSQVKDLLLDLKDKSKKLDKQTLTRIKNSCCHAEFIESFFKINGVFNALLSCLKHNDAQIQLEAVACLTNLACGPHKLCFRIAKSAGPYLVLFMTGSSHYLQAQCAWAIRNIANDCETCYFRLKSQGVFPTLLKILVSPIPDVIEPAIYALSACLKHGDLDLIDENGEKYSNGLLKLIEEHRFPIPTLQEAAFALANSFYIAVKANSDFENFDIQKVLECLKTFVYQDSDECLVTLQLIRCLGYLTSSEFVTEKLINCVQFHEITIKLLNHPFHFLKKELLWVLTNISVSQVIDNNHALFLPILKVLETFLNTLDSASLPALYYVCCTAKGNENICSLYQQYGVVSNIQNLMASDNTILKNSSATCLAIIQKPDSSPYE